MKLYYAPAACSLASHIALLEAGLKFAAEKVDLKQKRLSDGSDYRQINAQGYVPALQLKNGEVLTEGPAILQYIADQAPASNLAPANGSFARYKLQSWLNFIATELHKNFTPLFDPTAADNTKQMARQKLEQRFSQLDQQLAALQYLVGDYFTIADAYLFTVAEWAKYVKFEMSSYPNVLSFVARCHQRPAVQAALAAEGLLSKGA